MKKPSKGMMQFVFWLFLAVLAYASVGWSPPTVLLTYLAGLQLERIVNPFSGAYCEETTCWPSNRQPKYPS